MLGYIRALADGGILSVTLWNKEEPPKSVLKLYATMADAARQAGGDAANALFVSSSYLSTTTVLYKKGGFTPEEVATLRKYTQSLSFDEIYSPGFVFDPAESAGILDQYRASLFGNGDGAQADATLGASATDPSAGTPDPTGPDASTAPDTGSATLPSTAISRLVWHDLMNGQWEGTADQYVFDTRPLTNDRPYFAAYVRPADLGKTLDRLDIFQDDWGYLLVWATFGIACLTAASLVLLPVIFGWRAVFSRSPGKLGTVVYFGCLGLGYIMVEVGLISRFTLALGNATISASVLISGMLVFSGLGSFFAERMVDRAKTILPTILAAIGVVLFAYSLLLAPILDWIGAYPYAVRLLLSFAIIAPPAFLMGFPMATAMTWLTRLGKDQMFVWAWGINGCFSVIGAAAVPLIAVSFGLGSVLDASAAAYLLAIPAFFAVAMPAREPEGQAAT
jgi:hypothetical protein